MNSDAPAFNKAERLVIAGAVAPVLRDGAEKAQKRVVKTYSGRVVTLADVQAGLLAAKKIEIEVAEGVRPKESVCPMCERIFTQAAKGKALKYCSKKCRQRAKDRLRDPEKLREKNRRNFKKWAERNKEKHRETIKTYYAKNKERVLKNQTIRRDAEKKAAAAQ